MATDASLKIRSRKKGTDDVLYAMIYEVFGDGPATMVAIWTRCQNQRKGHEADAGPEHTVTVHNQ
jgi:hypothetical protein